MTRTAGHGRDGIVPKRIGVDEQACCPLPNVFPTGPRPPRGSPLAPGPLPPRARPREKRPPSPPPPKGRHNHRAAVNQPAARHSSSQLATARHSSSQLVIARPTEEVTPSPPEAIAPVPTQFMSRRARAVAPSRHDPPPVGARSAGWRAKRPAQLSTAAVALEALRTAAAVRQCRSRRGSIERVRRGTS